MNDPQAEIRRVPVPTLAAATELLERGAPLWNGPGKHARCARMADDEYAWVCSPGDDVFIPVDARIFARTRWWLDECMVESYADAPPAVALDSEGGTP